MGTRGIKVDNTENAIFKAVSKPQLKTTVTYTSGASEALGAGWDVMRVLYRREDGEQNSFLIARDTSGNIIRKTDLILERWEVVNEEDFLRECRNCYDERDRLAAEKAAGKRYRRLQVRASVLFAHQKHPRDRNDESR